MTGPKRSAPPERPVLPQPPATRGLLVRIQKLMAGRRPADVRLRQVVREIAAGTGSDVCSCYLRRAGNLLELFATHGLRHQAVHRTHLRLGEGLVGTVAAGGGPLAVSDAPADSRFAHRPQTGEEPFRAFLGVPLLRGGRSIGVLVIQSATARTHTDADIDTLQTVATVLAELVAGERLVDPAELAEASGNVTLPRRFRGRPLAGGIGIGEVVHHGPPAVVRNPVADDPEVERVRLQGAIAVLTTDLDHMAATVESSGGPAEREILDTFRLFVASSGWIRRMYEHIEAGLTAEGAVIQVQEETRARLLHVPDTYLRERLADFDDLANRLRSLLASGSRRGSYPDDVVLIARDIGPAALLEYGIERIRGLVLEGGAPSTHVAILARSLGVPVVGQVREAVLHVEEATLLALNGETGEVFVDPPEDVLEQFRDLLRTDSRNAEWHEQIRRFPSTTLEGVPVSLLINAGFAGDADQITATGAEGIGLYRTELAPLLDQKQLDAGRQEALYREVLERADGRPVTFRTLDLGGDKRMDAADSFPPPTHNPELGWRGIRTAFNHPQLLGEQLKALLRAHAGRPMRVMFPMVANRADLARARAVLRRTLATHEAHGGRLPAPLEVGVMVEVPALLWEADALLGEVDFVSVGTNDFTAFLYARDRGDPELTRRYPFLSGPPLNALRGLIRSARRRQVELSVCGEAAGQPLAALALVAIGVRTLSMHPSAVGAVKSAIRSFRMEDAGSYLEQLLETAPGALAARFRNYVRDHGVRVR